MLCYDNGDRLGRLLGRDDSFLKRGDEDIDLELHKFGHKAGDPVQLPIGIAILNQDVFPLNVAQISQPLPECSVRFALLEAEGPKNNPIRGTFFGCLRLDRIDRNSASM